MASLFRTYSNILLNNRRKKKILRCKSFLVPKAYKKLRMTAFLKTNFKISDDQANIDKYRLAANITEYLIISLFSKGVDSTQLPPYSRITVVSTQWTKLAYDLVRSQMLSAA